MKIQLNAESKGSMARLYVNGNTTKCSSTSNVTIHKQRL